MNMHNQNFNIFQLSEYSELIGCFHIYKLFSNLKYVWQLWSEAAPWMKALGAYAQERGAELGISNTLWEKPGMAVHTGAVW